MSSEPCAQCGGAIEPRVGGRYCEICRALPCFGCSKPYLEHNDELPASGARPRMPCIGLKRWYRPKKTETQGGEA